MEYRRRLPLARRLTGYVAFYQQVQVLEGFRHRSWNASPTAVEQSADAVVVGIGVGGEAVNEVFAQAGPGVFSIEAELIGGECPLRGVHPEHDDDQGRQTSSPRHDGPRTGGTSTASPRTRRRSRSG